VNAAASTCSKKLPEGMTVEKRTVNVVDYNVARLKKKAEEKGMRWAQILTSVRSIVPAVRQSIGGPLPTAGDQQRATQNKEREFHADNSL